MLNVLQQKSTAYYNGKVITVDANDTIAQAFLVVDDIITAVGDNEEILSLLPSGGSKVNLCGKSVIPGFIDSHVHLDVAIPDLEKALIIPMPGIDNIEMLQNAIKSYSANISKGEWIIVRAPFAMDQKLKEKRYPTIAELDAVTPEHLLAIFSSSHYAVLNTNAINKMGWLNETRVPRNVTVGRNQETGELSGVFTEAGEHLPMVPWSYDAVLEMLRNATVDRFIRFGNTSVHEVPWTQYGLKAWQQLHREKNLPLRVRFYIYHKNKEDFDNFIESGICSGFGDKWISFGGIKLFADGTMGHANMHPMMDIKWTQEELDDIVYRAHSSQMQIWIHALTPIGIRFALNSLERAVRLAPRKNPRHRIEHAGDRVPNMVDEDMVRRMKEAGIIPVHTSQFIYAFPTRRGVPLRTLIDKGFILPGSSDSTGTQPEGCNTWHSIWCSVVRRNLNGQILAPEECISPLEAIRIFTLWSAYGGFEEKIKGSIEPGKLADFSIIGYDPLTCDPDALREMPVEMVVIGGNPKYVSSTFKGI